MRKRQIKPGIYEHYKGKCYQVIGLARHSETIKEFVVYKALYKTKFGNGSLWIRPIEMFQEKIRVNGKMVPRFRMIQMSFKGSPKDRL